MSTNPRAASILAAMERFEQRRLDGKVKAPRVRKAKVQREFPLEADEQKRAVAELRKLGALVVATNNGAHLAGDREERVRKWGQLAALGASAGFPDLVVLTRQGVFFVEMKRQRGAYGGPAAQADAVSDAQHRWHERLSAFGFAVCVAYGATEAINTFRQFIAQADRSNPAEEQQT